MRRLLLSLVLLLPLSSGCTGDGGDPGGGVDAGPEVCTGCLQGDSCLPGTSRVACGAGGMECIACPGDDLCVAGECVPPDEPDEPDEPDSCGPAACGGCCDGEACLSGTASSSCGTGGEACVDCGPRGICQAGGCAIDPGSRWDLVAVGAVVPESTPGGGTWDPVGGAPDLFARGLDPDDEQLERTRTIDNSLQPVWDEVIAVDVPAAELGALVFEVLDDDVDGDDSVGRCVLGPPAFSAFSGEVIRYGCPAGGGYEIDLRFVPH